jgi:hypothetical protein
MSHDLLMSHDRKGVAVATKEYLRHELYLSHDRKGVAVATKEYHSARRSEPLPCGRGSFFQTWLFFQNT